MKFVRCCSCGWIEPEDNFTPDCPVCHHPKAGVEKLTFDSDFDDRDVEALWAWFANVPINDQDEIMEDFLGWDAGTDRFEIWHWFDAHYFGGVHALLEQD